MLPSDRHMLQLIDILKDLMIIRFDKEFCEVMGLQPPNLIKIRKGLNHFTPDHIHKAVQEWNVNANWIFGASEEVFNHKSATSIALNKTGN